MIIIGGGITWLKQSLDDKKYQNTSYHETNTNESAAVDLTLNPNYCQTADDCLAVPNPGNGCYFAYFNKNATEAIEEFKNDKKMMLQDCPQFGDVYCKDNKCTADRK